MKKYKVYWEEIRSREVWAENRDEACELAVNGEGAYNVEHFAVTDIEEDGDELVGYDPDCPICQLMKQGAGDVLKGETV